MSAPENPRKRAGRKPNGSIRPNADKRDDSTQDTLVLTVKRPRKSRINMADISSEVSYIQREDLDGQNLDTSASEFKLSKLAESLLNDLDKVEKTQLDREDLGRSLRLSPSLRLCLSETMKTCIDAAMQNAGDAQFPLETLRRLNHIQEIAEGTNVEKAFPFLKLPVEVRDMIYKLVLVMEDEDGFQEPIQISSCDTHKADIKRTGKDLHSLLLTCKHIHQEALPIYYQNNVFLFPCTESMASFLGACQVSVLNNIQNVEFDWICEKRDVGIARLGKLGNLQSLGITIHPATTSVATFREQAIRGIFFGSVNKMIRLVDSLGFDELMELRGLTTVTIRGTKALRRNVRKSNESIDLQIFVNKYLLLPRTPVGLQ